MRMVIHILSLILLFLIQNSNSFELNLTNIATIAYPKVSTKEIFKAPKGGVLRPTSEAPRVSTRGIFTSSEEPVEADPPSPRLLRIPFSHSSPPFRTGLSAKAGKLFFQIRDHMNSIGWIILKRTPKDNN